jgi:hypothetical protein
MQLSIPRYDVVVRTFDSQTYDLAYSEALPPVTYTEEEPTIEPKHL